MQTENRTQNENLKNEIKEHFLNESKEEKFARLQDEFADFIEYNRVKKI